MPQITAWILILKNAIRYNSAKASITRRYLLFYDGKVSHGHIVAEKYFGLGKFRQKIRK